MSAWGVVLLVAGLLVLGLALYWLFVIAEATYLGPRAVSWTYDVVARRYDRIKQFNARDEAWFVAGPVLRALNGVAEPLVLDVATGTGRVPMALLGEGFGAPGQIVGLDLSRGMLAQAREKLRGHEETVTLVRHEAGRLPFDDDTFDAVTSLESLEFMPDPEGALAEMVRVLAPGGVLVVTNRVGREARLLPGRAIPRERFGMVLAGLGLGQIEVRRWQVNYDLAAGRKGGTRQMTGAARRGIAPVRCPACGGGLDELACEGCGRQYGAADGVIDLTRTMDGEGR